MKSKKRPKSKKRTPKKAKTDWTLEDFVVSVGQTMETQAEEHPVLHQVHAKLLPEWKDVKLLALRTLETLDDAEAALLTEKLVAHGDIATRVLIDLLRSLHKVAP